MKPIQLWRILWARRLLLLATTVSCLIGGIAVIILVPPRWKAESHVILNLLKPDPVTGLVINEQSRSYVPTQINLITDYSVVGPTVDKLGWLSDPNLIQQYNSRSTGDRRDFRHWLAQLIADRTKADVEDGSNILTISSTWSDPEGAKAVADALLQSYMETSLNFRRNDAIKNANWFGQQIVKTKEALDAAENAAAKFERENGVVLTSDNKTDVDSARLGALATQGGSANEGGGGGAEAQLAEVEAQISHESIALGPNNPALQALQAKRAAYAMLVAKEHTAAGGHATADGHPIDNQKALVISERMKLNALKNLQTEVDIRRDLYNKTAQKEAEYRQQAAITDAGLTALGSATVPAAPSFPNIPLVIGGCIALGLVAGMLMALLVELLNRRVRCSEDVLSALDFPVLAILQSPR